MKTLLTPLALTLTLTLTLPSFAQNFEQGTTVVDGGIRLAVYTTTSKDKATGDTDTDGAAATLYPVNLEYGLNNRLGLGLNLQYSKFIIEKDSATGIKPSANSFEAAPFLNFHMVNRDRFDLYASAGFGLSSFKYANNLPNGGVFKGTGTFFNLKLESRIYLGKRIAIILNGAYLNMNYPNGKITDNQGANVQEISFKFSGGSFGTGLAINL